MKFHLPLIYYFKMFICKTSSIYKLTKPSYLLRIIYLVAEQIKDKNLKQLGVQLKQFQKHKVVAMYIRPNSSLYLSLHFTAIHTTLIYQSEFQPTISCQCGLLQSEINSKIVLQKKPNQSFWIKSNKWSLQFDDILSKNKQLSLSIYQTGY